MEVNWGNVESYSEVQSVNETTGKVIGFDKAMTPYIEITEEQRRQPLPDKYSYYAVENGEFVIKRRTPSEAETKADTVASINQQIRELQGKLAATDYQAIKYSEGWITEKDYTEIKANRQSWRDTINQLQAQLKEEE